MEKLTEWVNTICPIIFRRGEGEGTQKLDPIFILTPFFSQAFSQLYKSCTYLVNVYKFKHFLKMCQIFFKTMIAQGFLPMQN